MIYECMKHDIAKFDTQDYPKDDVHGMPLVNNKVLVLMTDECNGYGLRAKVYTFKIYDEQAKERAKGVQH